MNISLILQMAADAEPDRIVVVDTLPYNKMGKLLRREVRKLFAS